ncbi:hypothetical protein [Cellulosimicrobium protaetiae]|uniref:Uncharacterized protein n=1 Tax=Cellulosimicrobium protaetiae TaxID=2587808 RepID=A0A6M5UB73_9MICO|nr:hypothetical protein [Cellulosimicrobium protaetiae]QJW35500.1 hypothetical protein FIC82_004075 [Cellulosimicrobium protaetiae]
MTEQDVAAAMPGGSPEHREVRGGGYETATDDTTTRGEPAVLSDGLPRAGQGWATAGPRLGRAAARAGFGYVIGLAFSNVVVLGVAALVAAGRLADLSPADDLPVVAPVPTGSSPDMGFTTYVVTVLLLLSAALFAPFEVSWPGVGSFDLYAVPLTVTTLIAVALVAGTTWRADSSPRTARERWTDAGLTGAVLGLAGAVTALSVQLTFPAGYFATVGTVGAEPWGALAGGALLGTAATAVGHTLRRRPTGGGWAIAPERLGVTPPLALRRACGAAAAASVLLVAVAAVVVFLSSAAAAASDPASATIALLLVGPNLVAVALGVAGLGGLTTSVSIGPHAEVETYTLLHPDVPGAAWLLVLVPVVATVVAALRLHLGRLVDGRAARWEDAWATPTVLTVVALVAVPLAGVRATVSYESSYEEVAGAMGWGLAPWTVLVAALWGLLAEALSRVAGPVLGAALPHRVVRLLAPRPLAALPPVGPLPTGAGPAVAPQQPAAADPVRVGGAAGGVPAPEARAVDPRSARRILAVVALAAVVVVGAVVARGAVASTVFAPERPVERYLAALEAGDASRALALADPDVARAERVLLTHAVYEDAEARPSGARVLGVERDRAAGTAVVTVAWDQDGVKSEHDFTVRRVGSRFGVFDDWEIVAPPVSVVDLGALPGEGSATVVVNGVEVDVTDPSSPSFVAFPGRWEVTLPDAGPNLQSSTATLLVTAPGVPPRPVGSADDLPLRYSLTEAALEAAVEQAREQLDGCLAATSARPDGCPVYDWSYGASEAQDVTWTLATEPTFEAEQLDASTVRVHVSDGLATTSGTLPAQPGRLFGRESPEPYTGEVEIDYAVELSVQDGELVLRESAWW